MKRRSSLPGKPLEPLEKWRSLKLGDVVLESSNHPYTLVKIVKLEHCNAGHTVYSKEGMMLDLFTGETFVIALDNEVIRSEIIRADEVV